MGSRLHLILGHAHKVFVLGKPLTVATVWGCTGGATRDSTAPLDKRGSLSQRKDASPNDASVFNRSKRRFSMRKHSGGSATAAMFVVWVALVVFGQNAYGQTPPVLGTQPQPDGTPVPRTPDGRADLSGVWNKRLVTNTTAALEPLPFTPEGLKAFNDVVHLIDPMGLCIFPGIPRLNSEPYPLQIMQLPDKVIFLYEYMHNFRVIYTDGRGHRKDWEVSLLGDSIGKWEGDTLVIDTVGFKGSEQTWLDGHGNRHSDALHVTERWRRISTNQLWYEHTIDDPKFYTKPWTTGWVMPLAPKDWELLEYACTAGNRDLEGGHLQPGTLDGSGRDGSAIATPPPRR